MKLPREDVQNNKIFEKFGLKLYNVNRSSGLRAFDYVPFDVAVEEVLDDFPSTPFSLEGWYKK